mmetsp:Transcript_14188/g.21303  ORF Transcript_14188/g.21303 Transcript_14188/m.21303 type:complete len:155 (+) Transcript_14188:21-485(+)
MPSICLQLLLIILLLSPTALSTFERKQQQYTMDDSSTRMVSSLHQTVQCQCGKIELAIDAPSALRLVCYSQDYRGYYNALNEKAEAKNQPPNAKLDAWGGVDLTQIYVSFYSSIGSERVILKRCSSSCFCGLDSSYLSQVRSKCDKDAIYCKHA